MNTEVEEEDNEQIYRGRNGSCWLQASAPNQGDTGRLQQQNMMRIRFDRRGIPNDLKETCSLHDTTIVDIADAAVATVTITKYQYKKSKSVNIVSSLYSNAGT